MKQNRNLLTNDERRKDNNYIRFALQLWMNYYAWTGIGMCWLINGWLMSVGTPANWIEWSKWRADVFRIRSFVLLIFVEHMKILSNFKLNRLNKNWTITGLALTVGMNWTNNYNKIENYNKLSQTNQIDWDKIIITFTNQIKYKTK